MSRTEQFRPAVMTSGIHHLLTLVDQGEVEVSNDHAFSRAYVIHAESFS